ncbi:MAG: FkbM family methyltransferase [Thermodesulfobacteriota bacterium]
MLKHKIIEELNRAYFSEDCHEKEVLEHLPKLLKHVKVFVDIGASLGQYTFHANKHMKEGKIYAFEADPVRYEELEKNCKKWESTSTNRLIPIHAAVSDTDGKINFFITNSNLSGGLFTRDVPDKTVEWEEVSVNSIRLDSFFDKLIPELIKIDVEGAELSVLRGTENLLRNGSMSFLLEVHSFSGQINPAEVFQFMSSKGYYSRNFFGRLFFTRSGKYSVRDRITNQSKIHLYKLKRFFGKFGFTRKR